jgi:hypothetical protein
LFYREGKLGAALRHPNIVETWTLSGRRGTMSREGRASRSVPRPSTSSREMGGFRSWSATSSSTTASGC